MFLNRYVTVVCQLLTTSENSDSQVGDISDGANISIDTSVTGKCLYYRFLYWKHGYVFFSYMTVQYDDAKQ